MNMLLYSYSPIHTARWSRKIARKLPECLLCERKHVPGINSGIDPGLGPSNIAGVMPNSDPCQIITPLVLVGVGEGLGLGVGLGLGNQIAISTRGVIIWQGVENGHNTGVVPNCDPCQIITP